MKVRIRYPNKIVIPREIFKKLELCNGTTAISAYLVKNKKIMITAERPLIEEMVHQLMNYWMIEKKFFRYQILIPKIYMKELALEPGTEVDIYTKEGKIFLECE